MWVDLVRRLVLWWGGLLLLAVPDLHWQQFQLLYSQVLWWHRYICTKLGWNWGVPGLPRLVVQKGTHYRPQRHFRSHFHRCYGCCLLLLLQRWRKVLEMRRLHQKLLLGFLRVFRLHPYLPVSEKRTQRQRWRGQTGYPIKYVEPQQIEMVKPPAKTNWIYESTN